jgi:hypothetical protein
MAFGFLTLQPYNLDPFPRITGRGANSQQGQTTMKRLFYILRKDGSGKFRWVEAVNDVDLAEERVRQLCTESQDEFVVFRNVDLRVVAVGSENTYKRL